MTDQDFNTDDVSAMRREGDFKAFMRQMVRHGQGVHRDDLQRFRRQSSRPPAELPEAPDHIRGAWPVGPSDGHADGRTTCACVRCRSYAEGRPELDTLLRQTEAYLNRHEGAA